MKHRLLALLLAACTLLCLVLSQEIVSLDYKSYYCIIEMVEIDNEEIYPYIYVGDGNSNIEGEYYLINDYSVFDNEENLEVFMFNSIVEYINNN